MDWIDLAYDVIQCPAVVNSRHPSVRVNGGKFLDLLVNHKLLKQYFYSVKSVNFIEPNLRRKRE